MISSQNSLHLGRKLFQPLEEKRTYQESLCNVLRDRISQRKLEATITTIKVACCTKPERETEEDRRGKSTKEDPRFLLNCGHGWSKHYRILRESAYQLSHFGIKPTSIARYGRNMSHATYLNQTLLHTHDAWAQGVSVDSQSRTRLNHQFINHVAISSNIPEYHSLLR